MGRGWRHPEDCPECNGAGDGGYEREGRWCCVETLHGVHCRLRGRADSYWSDSIILKENGDEDMSLAYRTIADELRKVASSLGDDLGDGGVTQ